MSQWCEYVAFSLIDVSLCLQQILKQTNKRFEPIRIELMKMILICDPIHLYTSFAFEWIPPFVNIEFLHRTGESAERIKTLFGRIRNEIDQLSKLSFDEKRMRKSLKIFGEFLRQSIVEIRCQLIDEKQENLNEQLTDYYIGLGRLLSKNHGRSVLTKHFEDYRIKLKSIEKEKKGEQIFLSSPLLISSKSIFHLTSTETNKSSTCLNSSSVDRSIFDDLIVDAENFFDR